MVMNVPDRPSPALQWTTMGLFVEVAPTDFTMSRKLSVGGLPKSGHDV